MEFKEYAKILIKKREIPKCYLCDHFGQTRRTGLTVHHKNRHHEDDSPGNQIILCEECHNLLNKLVELPDSKGLLIKSYVK